MPLDRWDHGVCLTYGMALPVGEVGILAELVTTLSPGPTGRASRLNS
jgi:hypothetical protein